MATPVHAGMFKWVDDMFTFRKDQAARVSPHRLLPPQEVDVPYYDPQAATEWNNYYTRQDLQPETYLTGSASKVMRPADDYGGQVAEPSDGNVVISAPGQGAGMGMYTADVGRAAKVGPAEENWRGSELGDSRPGDYDYKWRGQQQQADNAQMEDTVPPQPLRRNIQIQSSHAPMASLADKHDPRYTRYNTQGQVTRYQVQHGDTLGSISGQPAIYDNWKLWPLIYSANRKAIGPDPDGLRYQQQLAIPRGYTTAQAKDAERRAMARKPGKAGDGQ